MKKLSWGSVFAAVSFTILLASCGNTLDESTEGELTGEKIPVGFVKVTGATITGDEKFALESSKPNEVKFRGVFLKGRKVKISDFYICNHEVTQTEYETIMGNNPSYYDGIERPAADGEKQENRPVENINWYAAITYCNKRSIAEKLTPCYSIEDVDFTKTVEIPTKLDDKWNAVNCDFTANGYRLPTEAEWEYAARGGKAACEAEDPDDWSGTDELSKLGNYAWYRDNSDGITHAVKLKKKNSLGLFDMTGNVDEWCWDWYDQDLTCNDSEFIVNGIVVNPTGAVTGTDRVIRGGTFSKDADFSSVAFHSGHSPHYTESFHGFRVVRSKL